jgi:hypothetical protein
MTKKPPSSTGFLYFVLLWCVFSFKVFVGGVSEAGVRIDDLLIAVAFAILLYRGDIARIPRSRPFRVYLIFLSISLFSALWNGIAGRVGLVYSMLFVFRLLEYLVFYYLGYVLLESGVRVWRGLKVYFYVLCAIVLFQMVHLLPSASQFSMSRASGNTNGPYELAAVAAFYLCYFAYRERRRLTAAAAFVILLLTVSRITFLGTVIGFVMRFISRSRSRIGAIAAVLLTILVIAAGATWISSPTGEGTDINTLGSRLNSSITLLSVDYGTVYAAVPTYVSSQDYITGTFLDATESAHESDSDVSGMVRAFRWLTLIKSTLMHFDSTLIGMGPSFGSAAVDGYYVRVFIESGLIGLVAFFAFLRSLTNSPNDQSGAFREFVIVLIVTASFIDIFASYKTMLFLWLWNGMNEFQARVKNNAHSLPDAS